MSGVNRQDFYSSCLMRRESRIRVGLMRFFSVGSICRDVFGTIPSYTTREILLCSIKGFSLFIEEILTPMDRFPNGEQIVRSLTFLNDTCNFFFYDRSIFDKSLNSNSDALLDHSIIPSSLKNYI